MEKYLNIGVITSTHGVRGEVRVFPLTDDPRRFRDLDEVLLRIGKSVEKHRIEQVKFVKNMVLLKLSGIDSMDDAQKLRSGELMIPREKGVPLEANEYYTADLIGMRVYTEDGKQFGELADVMQTGANDVYVVRTEAYGEVLIPAIRPCIINVDVEAGRMTVHLLPGLIDGKDGRP